MFHPSRRVKLIPLSQIRLLLFIFLTTMLPFLGAFLRQTRLRNFSEYLFPPKNMQLNSLDALFNDLNPALSKAKEGIFSLLLKFSLPFQYLRKWLPTVWLMWLWTYGVRLHIDNLFISKLNLSSSSPSLPLFPLAKIKINSHINKSSYLTTFHKKIDRINLLYHRNDCKYCLCVTVYCHHTFAEFYTPQWI